MLDIARIESGRLALAEEEVSIVELVSAVGDLSAIKARDKGLQFSRRRRAGRAQGSSPPTRYG